MVKLSPRLALMADGIKKGETVADIGTDHGLLPIFLLENKISPKVILVDIKEGPLDKAKENIQKHIPELIPELRLGSGIEPLSCEEVDVVVIAGMGGYLMMDILETDWEKTKSINKYILQPRNAPEKLRKWLLSHGFFIEDESLVREGKYICEVITALSSDFGDGAKRMTSDEIEEMEENLLLEISPLLMGKNDPLLPDFIANKIRIEEKIIADIAAGRGSGASGEERWLAAERRRAGFKQIQESIR